MKLDLIWRFKAWEEKKIQNLRCMSRNVSLNLNDINQRQASQWADQAQRERISLCGELELKIRLYQEKLHKGVVQEFQELRRRCNREERLTQHRLEELFLCSRDGIRIQ